MNISSETIQALVTVITGDGAISPRRSGPQLIDFFRKYGCQTDYGSGFPSRKNFTKKELIKAYENRQIEQVIQDILDPRCYFDTDFNPQVVADYLSKYLVFDGMKIVKEGRGFNVRTIEVAGLVRSDLASEFQIESDAQMFIVEQHDKCQIKIENRDYDGAITNARSMVESLFEELLKSSGQTIPKHDGDLLRLFKAVKELLNVDATPRDISDTLIQTLRGLTSVVSGIAGISNKMGDRHARSYKPEKHHALLAVNMAYSLSNFLLDSLAYQNQLKKGKEALNA